MRWPMERRRYNARRLLSWKVALLLAVLNIAQRLRITLSLIPERASRMVGACTSLRNANNDDDEHTSMDMEIFQRRKRKFTLQSFRRHWYQPPNPLLEDPVEFVQAILGALQMRNRNTHECGALCLLQSSTPSWRRILKQSVGAPSNATDYEVAPTLQSALERPKNQFAILTKRIEEEFDVEEIDEDNLSTQISSIQKCWYFPSDPVVFEADDEGILDHCWIESRLRSPEDDQLLAVVGWSLERRLVEIDTNDKDEDSKRSSVCWLLDGIDWQDFRDEFRPGIGREEWERICG